MILTNHRFWNSITLVLKLTHSVYELSDISSPIQSLTHKTQLSKTPQCHQPSSSPVDSGQTRRSSRQRCRRWQETGAVEVTVRSAAPSGRGRLLHVTPRWFSGERRGAAEGRLSLDDGPTSQYTWNGRKCDATLWGTYFGSPFEGV